MTRRTFLRFGGWLGSVTGAVYVVAVVRALLNDVPIINALLAPFGALRIRKEPRQFGQTHPFHTSRAKRRARLGQAFEPMRGFVFDAQTGIVHWAAPSVYKLRGGLRSDVQKIAVRDVLSRVGTIENWVCQLSPPRPTTDHPTKPHFEQRRAAVIRENLALAKLNIDDVRGAVMGIVDAKLVLEPLLVSPRQKCDLRIFELYCRLCCLQHAEDAKAARAAFTKAAPAFQPTGVPRMKWVTDETAFTVFHKKTNNLKAATFRRRLTARIKRAKFFLEGESSSGKDTAFRVKGGSNPPTSPSSNRSPLKPEDRAKLYDRASTSPKHRKKNCRPCGDPSSAQVKKNERRGGRNQK